MEKAEEWKTYKNILCIRLDNLGDVLMTSPAIRALKRSVSDRKITLLTSSAGKGITPFIPEIDEVIVFDTPWEKNKEITDNEEILEVVEAIKQKQFDAAVIFNVYSQTPIPAALLCYLAGIKRVAAYCRENPYHLIPDWVPDPEPFQTIRHEVDRQLALVKMLGAEIENEGINIKFSKAAKERVLELLTQEGIDIKKPWLIMHPGVSEIKRQYSSQKFAEAAGRLIHGSGFQVLLTGVTSEKPLTDEIAHAAGQGAFSLSGVFTLEELIALISMAPVLISNNTGPVHIAAAVNTPVVVLYALTNPQHAPWKVKHIVLPFDVPKEIQSKNIIIRFAYDHSFVNRPSMVTPDQIVEAVIMLLANEKITEKTEVIRL